MNRETWEYQWATTTDKASLWRAHRLSRITTSAPTLVLHLINPAFPTAIDLPTIASPGLKPLAGFANSTERPTHDGLLVRAINENAYLQVFRDTTIEYVNAEIAFDTERIKNEVFEEFLDNFVYGADKVVPSEHRVIGLSLLKCFGWRLIVPASRERAAAGFDEDEILSPLIPADKTSSWLLRRFVWQAAGYRDYIGNS